MVKTGYSEATLILIRRILPLLPSFAESFTCADPLTRKRDIAHRDNIPQNLKAVRNNYIIVIIKDCLDV